MKSIGGMLGMGGGGDDAADASIEASEIQAEYQREALDYLKQKEMLPTKIRDENLRDVNRFYQGGAGRMIKDVRQSPFYRQNVRAGEQAIGRNLSMTGGLRSGTANEALAQNSQNVLQNLVNQRIQGQQALAQMPSNANNIAQLTAGIGQTLGQGQVAAAQAQQAGGQQGIGNMMGLGQMGMQAYQTFSDPILKENVQPIGKRNGINYYSWTWNKLAEGLGLSGDSRGVMADEIKESHPHLIGERDGFMTVNYGGLYAL